MLNHFFDEAPDNVYSGPVATMDDDIPLAAIMGKLFGIVVDDISFLDRGAG